jgi:hypothetical protein
VIGLAPRLFGALAGTLLLGSALAFFWPAERAEAVAAERPDVLDAGPAPSPAPTSKPCGAFGRPEQPAICFKRFFSAGESCHHECTPLAGNAGWLAVLVCGGDPEPDAKVLP